MGKLIDTLSLSPLVYPAQKYHHLLKDEKLQTESLNNPLHDAQKAKDLLQLEISEFLTLRPALQRIFHALLHKEEAFSGFFELLRIKPLKQDPVPLIKAFFEGKVCTNAELTAMAKQHPVSLAYALALINCASPYNTVPPWVLQQYPQTDRYLTLLRGRPCLRGCTFCDSRYDIHLALNRMFHFDKFRTYGGDPLQEKAVKAAVDGKSILVVFPTGGGKSLTFQLPALMAGEAEKALTVVISPLQSLMKDQVDNLEKMGITEAVTINGLLDPIERAKAIERVEDGSAHLLYISPESLRSRTIERLLLGRKINRFVIDEAHCFSAWGQDFRIDYLYIGDFIKNLQKNKHLEESIPVSCFTATAKPKVIEDIRRYFQERLGLELRLFRSSVGRTNLRFEVVERSKEEEKYIALRDLIEAKQRPTIVYVSRTQKTQQLAERLTQDGFNALPYHGKMEKSAKTFNQNAFIEGDVPIMVATSAFGMGVDKKDVGLVVHFEISDSLENYVQEAGRAGRDESLEAECFVLFDEDDLSKHFILLNQTKLTLKEIQQVWKAIKDLTKFRSKVSNSALEIARKAGWDDSIRDIEGRVTAAIAALEEAGYLKRGQNMPRVFASSIQTKHAQEAIKKIETSERFTASQRETATRIIKKLFSSRSRKQPQNEAAEARVDYIADHLGLVRDEVITIIRILRDEGILADAKDLQVFIQKSDNSNRSLEIVESFGRLENFMLSQVSEQLEAFHLKSLHEEALKEGIPDVSPVRVRSILNYWRVKKWIGGSFSKVSKNHVNIQLKLSKEELKGVFQKRQQLSAFIVKYLFDKSKEDEGDLPLFGEMPLDFSVQELKSAYMKTSNLFVIDCSSEEVEEALYYLSRIEALKIEGGFLVLYNRLDVERIERDNRARYKQEDYQKLKSYYESKVQQIHIVGEYAKRMIADYQQALKFVEDYFQLNYSTFLNRYFKGGRQNEISRNITPTKFRQLFGELSPAQLKIINDKESPYIVVAAGPGSGKTRILVHKLASLLLMEDVKQEQLLMLTFSRAAATEFKARLIELIGNAALYVDIKTFHSYCFDLLGKMGSLDNAENIIKEATQLIWENKAEVKEITKTVLVIDEAQDMSAEEYALIEALMQQNEEMRVIAVGDDDQTIFEFRGASAEYLEKLIHDKKAKKYELVENYRSKPNLVHFTNQWVKTIPNRLKTIPIVAKEIEKGTLSLTQYNDKHLITPLVEQVVRTDLSGSVAVLTKTNEEALKVDGLLRHHGFPVKLIQSNNGFNLLDLYQIRYFVSQLRLSEGVFAIPSEVWGNAKRQLQKAFGNSSHFELISQMLADFERIYPKTRYISDFKTFITESKLEDFYRHQAENILVSTMHKAKGKEFDQVFLLYPQDFPNEISERRLLYVAMTRAKNGLFMHFKRELLKPLKGKGWTIKADDQTYAEPQNLVLHLGHQDVWLNYFFRRQRQIHALRPGEELNFCNDECLDPGGESVVKFSIGFRQKLAKLVSMGYRLQGVRINWMLYWRDKEIDEEALIILPEVVLCRELQN